MRRVDDGPMRRFETLARENRSFVYSRARQLSRTEADAEDLVQETHLRAWTSFHRFEDGTNFRAWISRILRNTSINRYHRERTRGIRVDLAAVQHALDSNGSIYRSPSRAQTATGANLHRALRRLPERYRSAVMLAFVGDLRYREIADILNCPIGTVMSRISRGRTRLRRAMSQRVVTAAASPRGDA